MRTRTDQGARRCRRLAAVLASATASGGLAGAALGGHLAFTQHIVTSSAQSIRNVNAADVDGDGDQDILAANAGAGEVAWYENIGGSPPVFIKHVIGTGRLHPNFVLGADMNNDGHMDVVSSSGRDDRISYYENDGGVTPSFTERVITADPNQNPNILPEGFADAVRQIAVGDFNGDGDLDVCSASVNDDKIAWFENPGVSEGEWIPRALTQSFDGARAVYAADLDNDGDSDIIAGAWYDERLLWFDNQGGDPPTFIERIVVTFPVLNLPDEIGQIWRVFSADMDGDIDLDILAVRRVEGLEWFENDGGLPPAFTRHIIIDTALAGKACHAADLDLDGHVDALFAVRLDDKVAWYQNDGGAPPSFVEHILTIDPDGPPPFGGPEQGPADGARAVVAVDLDGDGDDDVLWGARDNDTIGWEESHLICPADLDRDGVVSVVDFFALIAEWGTDPGGPPDLDGNGTVNIVDFFTLIAEWGPCSSN